MRFPAPGSFAEIALISLAAAVYSAGSIGLLFILTL